MTPSTYFLKRLPSALWPPMLSDGWEKQLCYFYFFAWTVLTRNARNCHGKNPLLAPISDHKNHNVCVFKKARQHQCWWLIDPLGANILTSVWLGSDLVQPIDNEISGFELSTPTNEKHLLLRCCSGGRWVQFPPTKNGWYQYQRCFFVC